MSLGSLVMVDPLDANQNDLVEADWSVGTLAMSKDGKIFRFIMAVDLDLVAGWSVEWASALDDGAVSGDRAGGSTIGTGGFRGKPAGVAQTAITVSQYGWIQVFGFCENVLTDGGVAAGHLLYPDATANGVAQTLAVAGAYSQAEMKSLSSVFGFALAADAANTLSAAQISCL